MVIIFPLRNKLHTLFNQQRPRYTGGRRVEILPTLPFGLANRPNGFQFGRYNYAPTVNQTLPIGFALCALQLSLVNNKSVNNKSVNNKPNVVHGLKPMPTEVFEIVGVSKDNSGTPLGTCTMNLFRVDRDSGNNKVYIHLGTTISDASGNYVFVVNKGATYRVTGEQSTIVGMTIDTLTGVLS